MGLSRIGLQLASEAVGSHPRAGRAKNAEAGWSPLSQLATDSSRNELPPISASGSGSAVHLAASISLNSLRAKPSNSEDTFEPFSPAEASWASQVRAPKVPLGERLRQPPSGSRGPSQPATEAPEQRSQPRSPRPSHRKANSHSKKGRSRSHDRQHRDTRSVAMDPSRRRSNQLEKQMLVENPEYMEDQMHSLRRGKVYLRNRVNQCSDNELFENRNFYTSYAVHIHKKGEQKKQNEELKAKMAKDYVMPDFTLPHMSLGGVPEGKHATFATDHAVTWAPTVVAESQHLSPRPPPSSTSPSSCASSPCLSPTVAGSKEAPRRKKKGERGNRCSIAMEVRALQEQMEGSMNLQAQKPVANDHHGSPKRFHG